MHRYRAIALKALQSVVEADEPYLKRYVTRWYSTTFHTPLHEVEELPFEYVLEHYHEHTYAQLDPEKLDKAIEEAIKDERDIATEQESDDDFVRELENLNKKVEKISKTLAPIKEAMKPLIDPKTLEHLEEINMTFDGEGNIK